MNADDPNILGLTGDQLLGANLFAYCANNPIMYMDYAGAEKIHIETLCKSLNKPRLIPIGCYFLMNRNYKLDHYLVYGNGKLTKIYSPFSRQRFEFYKLLGFKCSEVVKKVTIKKGWALTRTIAVTIISAALTKKLSWKIGTAVGLVADQYTGSSLPEGEYEIYYTTIFTGWNKIITEDIYRISVDRNGKKTKGRYKIRTYAVGLYSTWVIA